MHKWHPANEVILLFPKSVDCSVQGSPRISNVKRVFLEKISIRLLCNYRCISVVYRPQVSDGAFETSEKQSRHDVNSVITITTITGARLTSTQEN